MTKDLQNMTKMEQMVSLLNLKNKKEINEMINETIQSYREGNKNADKQLEYLFEQMGFKNLDQKMTDEIKNDLLMRIKSDAGYFLKEDYNFNFGGGFNSGGLKESITGDNIKGPDSPRIGDIYTRKKDNFGIYHQEPKAKKQDKDELDIQKKLELLKKLFQNRNKKRITLDMIRNILTTESQEQLIAAKQFLQEADSKTKSVNEKFVVALYFSESSPITSTFSHNAYSGFKYVHLSKDNVVSATNSFFVKIGDTLTKERIQELQAIGIKLYFGESLNEALHGDENILEEISYDEMLETVAVNIQAEEVQEKLVMFEFEKLLKIKIKSARTMIKRAAKQIAIEVSHNNKKRIL